jgi:hypothetical protein
LRNDKAWSEMGVRGKLCTSDIILETRWVDKAISGSAIRWKDHASEGEASVFSSSEAVTSAKSQFAAFTVEATKPE